MEANNERENNALGLSSLPERSLVERGEADILFMHSLASAPVGSRAVIESERVQRTDNAHKCTSQQTETALQCSNSKVVRTDVALKPVRRVTPKPAWTLRETLHVQRHDCTADRCI